MSSHLTYLKQSLLLAKTMQGFTAPNPSVGAVIVKNEQILAESVHRGPGFPHAEVDAIQKIPQSEISGASLYVTLEPCCHHGRTPPCVDLIIQSDIQVVYYGLLDPKWFEEAFDLIRKQVMSDKKPHISLTDIVAAMTCFDQVGYSYDRLFNVELISKGPLEKDIEQTFESVLRKRGKKAS